MGSEKIKCAPATDNIRADGTRLSRLRGRMGNAHRLLPRFACGLMCWVSAFMSLLLVHHHTDGRDPCRDPLFAQSDLAQSVPSEKPEAWLLALGGGRAARRGSRSRNPVELTLERNDAPARFLRAQEAASSCGAP